MVTHTPSFILFIKGLEAANQQLIGHVSSRIHDLTIVSITNGLQAQRVQEGPFFSIDTYPTLVQTIQTSPPTFRKFVGMEIMNFLGMNRPPQGLPEDRTYRDDRPSRNPGGLYGDPQPRKAGRRVVVVEPEEYEPEPELEPYEESEEDEPEEYEPPKKSKHSKGRQMVREAVKKTKESKGRELARKKLEPREQKEPKSVAKGKALAQSKLSVLAKKRSSKRRGMSNIMAAAKSMEKEMEQAYEYDD